MLPQAPHRKRRNSSRVNLLISLTFHAAIVLTLTFFAARQGFLGKQLKKITVEMVREKPPEKPKEKEPEKPKELTPKPEPPKLAAAPKVAPVKESAPVPPPAAIAAPPPIAPPPVTMPSFVFEGGKVVQSSSDPIQLYKGLLEAALRSKWNRPADVADDQLVAEVEVAVKRTGQITDPVWKKSSGDTRWDASVRAAIRATQSMSHVPPTNFPPRVLVRFDVQETTEPVTP